MRLALYQPDIPQNAGTLLRLGACLGVVVDVIEPCGFLWHDRHLRRAGMDYLDSVQLVRHAGWADFATVQAERAGRLVLLTTKAETAFTEFAFRGDDTLLVGRESAGVPACVHRAADARVRIPILDGLRSMNVALAAAMVLGEALRQTDGFPTDAAKPEKIA